MSKKQNERISSHIERLEYYASLVYELCKDELTVSEMAMDASLVLKQKDEEVFKYASQLYTASQAVGYGNFILIFSDGCVEVKVKQLI